MHVLFFNKSVKEFICSLNNEDREKVYCVIKVLRTIGSIIDMPLSKPIGSGLFELRAKNIRIIYVYKEGCAVLLNAFKKKMYRIPQKEIDLARERFNNL
ncbi:MAG: type II toxin-antitoxin system RelE/ParE family toxin [Candidatus Taylorbacteria bacterium]|nr:type II toxin-antitoxin system RelE/ParE family toxin [Candidatus Taylorbacteria bacterium]